MVYNFVARLIARLGFIAFWIGVIALFVYFSPITNLLLKPPRSISVATWPDYIDEDSVREFEKKTGVTVYINFYENNEELLSKLELTKSRGFDLVLPTDSSTRTLIKNGMLKKLDKSKLNFWKDLDSRLLGHYFDPKNEYSIPYYWDLIGIGYDKAAFKGAPVNSWSLLFEEGVTLGHVGMTDDPGEVIFTAAQYLFGSIKDLSKEQLEQVKELLLKQKRWVESYSDLRGEFLLYSKTSSAAMIPSFQVWSGIKSGQFNDLGFMVPKDAFMLIDNVVIPKSGSNTDLVYEFINFLYKKDVLRINSDLHGFLPSRKDLMLERNNSHMVGAENLSTLKDFKKFSFFDSSISRQDLNQVWLAVKAA
ncbi:MAG TPA: spermidine/putrescine ABC transporter substrate-binding protein [Candidatus Babeliales bacterium]|nr:spermidine/putrescine ABC transporter substrate-binding protein [Candidatus Babeliales bacterium]